MSKKIFIITLFLFIIGLMVGCNITGIGGDSDDDSGQKEIYNNATNDTKSYEEWLRSIKGNDGREIELFVMDNIVAWRYVGDTVAVPLFSIDSINGIDGVNGTNGVDGRDGREVAIRFFNNSLQWHYTDENEWRDLFNTSSLKGEAGNDGIGIRTIEKVRTDDLVDTYAIYFTDGTMTTFTITNGVKGGQGEKGDKGDKGDQGEQGVGIKEVKKISTDELEDTYQITFTDDTTTTFTLTNGSTGEAGEKGNGITKIELYESPNAFLDIYRIYFDDETTFDFEVHHGEPLDQRKFIVKFDSDGGTEVEDQEVQFGYKAIAPEAPEKEGYDFLGWFIGDEKWSFIGYFVTENVDLVAKWELATYEITYNYNGGEEIEDPVSSYTMLDNDITLPNPEKEGYTFLGWCESEELLNPSKVITSGSTGDKELFAKWEANTHKITFESNGGTHYYDMDFSYGEDVELPTPERTGYRFMFWSAEENMFHEYKDGFKEDTDLVLYARWIVDGNAPYTVLVYLQNLDGTYSMKPYEELTYDAQPETTVSAPTNYYPGFDQPNYTPSGLGVSDGSLKLKVFYPRGTYQLSVYDGMSNWSYYLFKYGEEIKISSPEKTGYVFTGWNRELPETMPSYSFDITATWQANLYKVTFDANGGNDIAMKEYMYGQQVELPIPTFDGYEFAGWYCEGRKVEDGVWNYLKNITLVANWATRSGDFSFAQVGDHLELTSYTGNETEITVPSVADGMPVQSIAANAFNGNSNITKIILQSGIKSLGEGAFSNMSSLTELVLPGTVVSYGANLLTGSDSIEKITIASNFNKQLRYLFGNNIANVPASLVYIKYANGCSEINSTMWSPATIKNGGDPIVLELASDMTSIPSYAFSGCQGLVSVIIPEGVTYINERVFYGCSNLEKVVLPTTLYTISNLAFYECTKLSDINLEDCSSLYNIYSSAFNNCDALTEITLPTNLQYLNDESFAYCDNLAKINFNEKLNQIGWGTFRGCNKLTEVVLPSSIDYISNYAFENCQSLTHVIIPKGINTIYEYAFNNCSALTILCGESSKPSNWPTNWASGVGTVVWNYKEIKNVNGYKYAFTNDSTAYILGVEDLSKTKYEFPSTVDGCEVVSINLAALFRNNEVVEEVIIPDSITAIPNYSFSGCTSLTKVTFGNNSDLTSIGSYAFNGCSNLKNFVIPENVTYIGSNAFSQCSSLTSINIPTGVTIINDNVFAYCTNLKAVILPNSITNTYSSCFGWDNSLQYVFYSGTPEERNNIRNNGNNRIFDNNVKWYYESAVQEIEFVETENYTYLVTDTQEYIGFSFINKDFTEFSFDSISEITFTEISDSMFYGCANLTSIEIPASVTRIGNQAFYGCTSLSSVTFEAGSRLLEIGYEAFRGCSVLAAFNFPTAVNTIRYNAFCECSKYKNVIIPASVTTIESGAFNNMSANYYCAATEEPEGWSHDWNCGYKTNWGVARFGSTDAFDYIVKVTDEVTITSLTNAKLASYELPDTVEGLPVTELGSSLLYNNDKLTSITLPNNLKVIGDSAFYDCDKIQTIVLPNTVEEIGLSAFYSCEKLQTVSGAQNLKEVKGSAFGDCYQLQSFTGPTNVEYIRYSAFNNCYNLKSFFSIDNVKEIGNWAFYNCDGIIYTLNLKKVEQIGEYAFYDCNCLTTVILPDTLTRIDGYAFSCCYQLMALYIPFSVTTIGPRIIQNCSYTTIYCQNADEPNGWDAGWNYNDNDIVWSADHFQANNNMVYFVKDNGNATLISYTDRNSNYVKLDTVDGHVIDEIARYAFYDLDKLSIVIIPTNVETIEGYAFYDCNNVRLCCEVETTPHDWDGNFIVNGYSGIYYNYDINRELIEVTFTSADSSREFDGSWWVPTGEITLTSGELADGDTFSANYSTSYGDKGTYEARFSVSIYDSQMNDVSKYYIINKVYGTYTVE